MKWIFGFLIFGLAAAVSAQTRTIKLPDLEKRQSNTFPLGPATAPTDPLLMALGNPQTRQQAIRQYKTLGAKSVPDLVTHLRDPNTGVRLLALSALQYAWVPGTENSVLPFLKSARNDEAKSAWYLLKQKMDAKVLDQWALDNIQDLNVERAEELLSDLESERPDSVRMRFLLNQPRLWKASLPHLPRYTGPEFSRATRGIAGQAEGGWLALAQAALIQQGDRDPAVMKQMEIRLENQDPRVREMSAEYFRWHGGPGQVRALEEALATESDLFAKASLREALRVLRVRPAADFPPPPQPMEPLVNYARGLKSEQPEAVKARVEALREALGYKELPARSEEQAPWVLVPPTRSFLLARNNGFGFKVVQENGPFADSVHVAQDVSWGEEMASVLAIAPGVVKRVRVARESWGGLVVLEHTSPNGRKFCSLYGHLGPLITVRPGETIAAGTKLGGLGRSYTAENGGYLSHLHFGIYDDAYGRGRWVAGYMDPEKFEKGGHKWIDPYTLYPAGK